MIPVEIKLNDFEEFMKDAKSFMRVTRVLQLSTFLLVVISWLCDSFLEFLGVVLLLAIAHMFLSTVLPNWVYVKESYKKAKEFYQSLSYFKPYCDVPMHIEGSYDRATITYNFDFKPCSYS